ncbi:MAG: hypothetical protein SGI72_04665 [Planctomycetota bacterium]|nr:hypothetical protein [Planctomycetota bacterium]
MLFMQPGFFIAVTLTFALTAIDTSAEGSRSKPKARLAPLPANFFPPPAPLLGGSDSCATPDAIAGIGLFAFDDTNATTGTQGQSESACNAFGNTAILADVWFVWTAPSSGMARVTTVNQTIVDTKIAAYPGGACPSIGSALACNDDDVASGSFQSTIAFRCTAGSSYLLQIGTFPGPFPPPIPGTGNISIQVNTSPANDACTNPLAISGIGAGAPHPFDTTLASTGAQGQANVACESYATRAIDADVWFQWTAPVFGWVKLTTCAGSSGDTKVAVYSGAGCPVGQALVCDDDGCGTYSGPSEARFFASVGTTYTIQLGSFPNQPGSVGTFTIELFTQAVGDTCSGPIAIAGRGPHAFDNHQATTGNEGQLELLCTTPTDTNPRITYDLWYAWTAPGTGIATWSLCGVANMDSKIAVYSGTACPTAAALACADDGCASIGPAGVLFPVTAGATYMLQLGNWPGGVAEAGSFTIDVAGGVGSAYCFGAGGVTSCPCSPTFIPPAVASNGCPNSLYAGGANLRADGLPSVANDSLTLHGTGMQNGSCIYIQGTAQQSGGNGLVFGDGLLCVGGAILRLAVKFNVAGSSALPSGGGGTLSSIGLVPPAGGVRTYQVWYRDANVYCSVSTFNLTNAVSITWSP